MQLLGAPAVSDEARGEIVEQFRMRRRIAAQAKVARRPHQSRAKMVEPNAIDPHPRGKRIVGSRDRLSHFEPAAPLDEWFALVAFDNRQELPWDLLVGPSGIAAKEDARLGRCRV